MRTSEENKPKIQPTEIRQAIMTAFPAVLKSLRKENNETQSALADSIGASLSSVSNWEQGRVPPDMDMLVAIALHYGCSVDYLIGRTPNYKTIENQFIGERLGLSDSSLDKIMLCKNGLTEILDIMLPKDEFWLFLASYNYYPSYHLISEDDIFGLLGNTRPSSVHEELSFDALLGVDFSSAGRLQISERETRLFDSVKDEIIEHWKKQIAEK